ncbi:MAG: ABC-2 transporter permease [Clostridia bacterium]|nr:ABC-2 transporter permease [Clostridia bacterium]
MKNLLKKELRLAMHPTAPLFLGLSAMLLIPNYPYLVAFFYTGLAIFFMCLNGRENRDIPFTMLLPVAKRDIVHARIWFAVIQQLLQMLLAIPFAVLNIRLYPEGNAAGLDAGMALFGCAFILYGGFNFIFFTGYYKDVSKVGAPFLLASTWVFVWIGCVEASSFLLPFSRDFLDTPDPQYLPQKLVVLLIGAVVYAVLTALACRKSIILFEKQDL